jgi:outer membrane receptor protein involved in Fe transport
LFYKEFDNPIEVGKVLAQQDLFTWFNAEEAELSGIEYEIRKDLYFGEWFGLSDAWDYFTLGFNISYIDSEVTQLGEGETAEDVPLTGGRRLGQLFRNEREMTGQSDWLGNLVLSYENFDLGLRGSLAYNYTGESIFLVGDRNDPEVFLQPRGQVDLNVKYEFTSYGQDMELELKVRNIFDESYKLEQGGQIFEEWEVGQEWKLGITARF